MTSVTSRKQLQYASMSILQLSVAMEKEVDLRTSFTMNHYTTCIL